MAFFSVGTMAFRAVLRAVALSLCRCEPRGAEDEDLLTVEPPTVHVQVVGDPDADWAEPTVFAQRLPKDLNLLLRGLTPAGQDNDVIDRNFIETDVLDHR